MPQVVGSIFPGSKSLPFLLDRQFWITSFMYAHFLLAMWGMGVIC